MLTEILECAVDANAETVVLEYATGGLEVSYMFGNTGIGEILHDRALVEAIMACAWDRRSRQGGRAVRSASPCEAGSIVF
jgi:hypothetical protein